MMPEYRPNTRELPHVHRLWRAGRMCALGLVVALSACAQLEVRRQSTSPEVATYELRGATVAHLQTEAARLCPAGYAVARVAESDVRQPGGWRVVQWWNQGLSWLEDERREAQMVITCTPPVPQKSGVSAEVQGQAKT